jgi:ferredoxin
MKVKVDREKCIGCGACAATCQDNFEIDDENKAKVKHNPVPEEIKECTKNAADSCPVNAIKIEN